MKNTSLGPIKKFDKQRYLSEAEKLFGKGIVHWLSENSLDFLEEKREGVFLYDENGNKYIDGYSSAGTYNLGRRHFKVQESLKKAINITDQGNFIAMSGEKALLAEKLADFFPNTIEGFLFSVVRGEAMDAACKLARGFTGRSELMTVDGGWYGQTGFALSLSENEIKKKFGNLIPDTRTIPFNDQNAASKAISKKTAAVIIELIQTENGCREVDQAYLKNIRSLCDTHGVLLIIDETQTGFGRTGAKFSCDHFDILPDIIVFGEAISSGLFPMCGMGFTSRVKKFFDEHPLIHMHTFGGHDIGCVVASDTLEIYEKMQPWNNAKHQGKRFRNMLEKLKTNYEPLIKIQGQGLLLSLIFSAKEQARQFCIQAKNNGVILLQGEVESKSVIIRPPLTISDEEIDMMTKAIEVALKNLQLENKVIL